MYFDKSGIDMKNDFKITNEEFQKYCDNGGYYVSDMSYGMNRETGEYDVPVVEWESDMGRYWERFDSEEARSKELQKNDRQMKQFVLDYRKLEAKRILKKLNDRKKIQTLRTLGGQFPELELLKFKY